MVISTKVAAATSKIYGNSAAGKVSITKVASPLAPLLSQRVTTLSGGEKQRVAIARSLILDPYLILADEPTGNLDPKNRDIIMNLLRHEHEKGRGIILITHDMEIAKQAENKLLLENGKLHDM